MSTTSGTATIGTLTEESRTMYEMTMLPRAIPPHSYLWLAQNGVVPPLTIPEHAGATVNWRLLAALTAVTTPLTEGVTPDPQSITITATEGTVAEYGSYIRYTKKLALLGIDMVAAEASDALGEQAGDSFDQLVRDAVVAGTSKQYAGDATSTATVDADDKLTAEEILEAIATLKTNKAQPLADGKYITLIHPKVEYDLLLDPLMQALLLSNKGETDVLTKAALGDAFGARFYVTPNAATTAGTLVTTVYYTMMFGRGSFGIGGLAGYMPGAVNELQNDNNTFKKVRPIRLIDKGFDSGGTSDPLEQRATIAWYSTFVVKILTQNFMIRIEHSSGL